MIRELVANLASSVASSVGPKARDPLDDYWYEPVFLGAFENFHPDEALQLGPVQDSLAALADPVGTLPLHIFERASDGGRRRNDAHPLARVLSKQANRRNSACEVRSFMQRDLGWHKNALAEILQGTDGNIEELRPISWNRVIEAVPERDGSVLYRFRERDGTIRVLRNDQVLHLRAAPFDEDCICGEGVYKTGKATLGFALAVHLYGRTFFANSGKSGGVIQFPNKFKTPEDRKKFLGAWRTARTGPNAHKDAIIEDGGEYKPHVVNNNEAQFRETKADSSRAVGRLWRMPPHKIGDMERATFSNIEQQSIEFVQETLLPWLVVWEQAIARDLLFDDPQLFAEFDIAGLLRGDQKSRFEAYAKARQWGWMTRNEIRKRENLDPVEGGDDLLTPLNMVDMNDDREDERDDNPNTADQDIRNEVLTDIRESEEKKAA